MKSRVAEYFGFVLIAAITAMISGAGMARWTEQKHVSTPHQPVILPIGAQALLDSRGNFRGDPSSPFTLVEFMDYQCPPCKRMEKKLPSVLKKYKGKLRLTIRNCPLSMHEYAIPAAIAAEAAREQGKFWLIHDALMHKELLQSSHFEEVVQAHNLDMALFSQAVSSSAKDTVATDMAQAKALHISATPTFILCTSQGQVIRLGSIDQIQNYIK